MSTELEQERFDVAGVGRVDDPPALDLPGRDLELRLLPTVHESHVPLAAGVMLVLVAEQRHVPVGAELEIVEDENLLAVDGRLI